MNSGLYIALFHLHRGLRLRVGALGKFRFWPGVYLYVGSAQRNLAARVERHGRKNKPLRWHIDYLSAKATMLGAVLVPGSRRRECGLPQQVATLFGRVIPGFGASDCGCGGHLFVAVR
jgi:sugar fermentation stimulation protein A